jgi:tetratricopeptide (TPR) repeat protein
MMGGILVANGEYQQAVEQVEQAAALAPQPGSQNEVYYPIQLADVYVKPGDTEQAIATSQRASAVDRRHVRSDFINAQLKRLGQD